MVYEEQDRAIKMWKSNFLNVKSFEITFCIFTKLKINPNT